jgi:hypothetical protein
MGVSLSCWCPTLVIFDSGFIQSCFKRPAALAAAAHPSKAIEGRKLSFMSQVSFEAVRSEPTLSRAKSREGRAARWCDSRAQPLAAVAPQIIQQEVTLLGREGRKAVADQLSLHALDLELPHFVREAAGCEQPMAPAAATAGVQLCPTGVRLRQLGVARHDASDNDPKQRRLKAAENEWPLAGGATRGPHPVALHSDSRKYAACPVVSSTPISMARIRCTPSTTSSRRISPAR